MITKTKPYDHQLTAYNKAYDKHYFALFMEMGTGKTKVSIDLAGNYFNEMKIDAVLVVAPNNVHRQWAIEQIVEHCPVPYTTLIWSAVRSKTIKFTKEKEKFMKSNKLKFFCVNIETFSSKNYIGIIQNFLKDNRCLMVVDESTVIKEPTAKRTRAILNMTDYTKYRLILTGTPVTNSPFDLWSQFEFLREGFFGCIFLVFKHRFGILIGDENEITGKKYKRLIRPWEIVMIKNDLKKGVSEEEIEIKRGITIKNVHYIATHDNIDQPYKSLNKLKAKIAPHVYIVKKEDCLDLPSKIYEPIYVEMSQEQKKVYRETKKKMMSMYDGKSLTVMNKLSLMLRLQQITGGFFPYDPENGEKKPPVLIGKTTVKFKRLQQDLEQIRGDEKIIIWCKFTAEIRYLEKELKKMFVYDRVETYYGGTPKTKGFREGIIADFKKGDIKILIANPQSAGIGLNLQKSSLHYYYSNDFSLERRLQSEDRSHRIGQTNHVVYKDIIVLNSMDQPISDSLIKKKNLLEFFREKSLKELLDEGEIPF